MVRERTIALYGRELTGVATRTRAIRAAPTEARCNRPLHAILLPGMSLRIKVEAPPVASPLSTPWLKS